MMKLLSIFFVFSLYKDTVRCSVSYPEPPEKIIYQLENINELFNNFRTTYNKAYNSAEIEHRRKVFEENLKRINKWNREEPHAVYGIGPFTDLTFEEFKQTYAGCIGNFTNDNAVLYEPTGMAPESLDWRQSNIVTRVKNQQSCGSCYVFSAVANIESLHAKKHGQLIQLSEQQGLDCNPRGCEGGFPHEVMQTLAREGCMRESDYPYESVKKQCRTNANKIVARVTGGQQNYIASEEALKDAVASYGPLAISFSVEQRMMDFRGGVFIPQDCQNSQSYHAVLLIGYGSDGGTPYWLMKNSWGEQWNERGYFRLLRGRRACHIGEYVATATIA